MSEILAAVADAIAGVGYSVSQGFAQVVSAAGSIAWTVAVFYFGAGSSRSPSSISESFQVASTDFGVRVPGASNKGLFTRVRGRNLHRTSP